LSQKCKLELGVCHKHPSILFEISEQEWTRPTSIGLPGTIKTTHKLFFTCNDSCVNTTMEHMVKTKSGKQMKEQSRDLRIVVTYETKTYSGRMKCEARASQLLWIKACILTRDTTRLERRKPKGGLAQKIQREEAEAAAAAETAAGKDAEAASETAAETVADAVSSSDAETAIEEATAMAPIVEAPLTISTELLGFLVSEHIRGHPTPELQAEGRRQMAEAELNRIIISTEYTIQLKLKASNTEEIDEVFGDLREQPQDPKNFITDDEAPHEDPPDVLNRFFGRNLLTEENSDRKRSRKRKFDSDFVY